MKAAFSIRLIYELFVPRLIVDLNLHKLTYDQYGAFPSPKVFYSVHF